MAHWLNQNESRLNIVATFDLIYNAAILVKENVGYALGFDNLVNTSLESILCFRPIEPEIQAEYVFDLEEKSNLVKKCYPFPRTITKSNEIVKKDTFGIIEMCLFNS